MKTMKSLIAAANILFALALTFSGCSGDSDDGGDGGGKPHGDGPQVVQPLYEEYRSSEGNSVYSQRNDISGTLESRGDVGDIPAGSVTNGNVNFQFSQAPSAEYLVELAQASPDPDCTFSPADLKIASDDVQYFYFSADDGNGYRLGTVAFKNGVSMASAGEIRYSIDYMYLNKAGRISCSGRENGIITDINAGPGWVRRYVKEDRTKVETTVTSDPSILPEGVELRWVIRILEEN
jgi:hypothetical protein